MSTCGAVVAFSPSKRAARVRIPAGAIFLTGRPGLGGGARAFIKALPGGSGVLAFGYTEKR